MTEKGLTLSIIIPVYNKDETIKRGVESVLRQGLLPTEYELLLIDDGSTDNSAGICQQFASDYPEVIRFFSKQNEGVGPTRNFGIDHAKGEYVCFLDADDYLKDGGFRDFMDHFYDNRFDVLSYFSTTVKENHEHTDLSKTIHGKIEYETTGHEHLSKGYCPTFVWNSWVRKTFLIENGLKFEPISYGEDLLFNINLMYANPKIRQTSSFIYQYVTYEGGGQLSKVHDIDKTTQNVLNYMNIFMRMGEVSKRMKADNRQCDMESIFENSLVPFTSRLLSSGITVNQLREIKKTIQNIGLNKRRAKDITATISRLIINSGYAFTILRMIYRNIFKRYVLPRIDRETGKFAFS